MKQSLYISIENLNHSLSMYLQNSSVYREILKYQNIKTVLLAGYSEQINLERVSSLKREEINENRDSKTGSETFWVI